MHHIEIDGLHFNYNSDASGDVEIHATGQQGIIASAATLMRFVAHLVRNEKIGQLEQASDDAILGVTIPTTAPKAN